MVRLSTLAVVLSGAGFFWAKYLVEPPPDAFSVVNHPLEPWLLKAHVLAAPLFVFAVGLIAVAHVARHLRTGVRLGRASGLATLAALGPMTISGYLLQVVTAPAALEVLAWIHIITGAGFTLAWAAHWAAARRAARACVATVGRIAEAASRGMARSSAAKGPDRETFAARIRTEMGRVAERRVEERRAAGRRAERTRENPTERAEGT
ncbi:MAG: hypothetical protein RRA92_07625 [Gemmatimonadota bacterium]|nr:hypothetical protein [Gemmatimonadota bacterium]